MATSQTSPSQTSPSQTSHSPFHKTILLLPITGLTPQDFPEFLDCFPRARGWKEEENHVFVLTRSGGIYRKRYKNKIKLLRESENYITDFDDSTDGSFASFVFSVPEKWISDYKLLKQWKIAELSPEYISEIKSLLPYLSDTLDSYRAER